MKIWEFGIYVYFFLENVWRLEKGVLVIVVVRVVVILSSSSSNSKFSLSVDWVGIVEIIFYSILFDVYSNFVSVYGYYYYFIEG